VEKYGRGGQATDENIIRRMRTSCWITKATDTLRIVNTYCFSMSKVVTRTRLSVTLHIYGLSSSLLCSLDLVFEVLG
jgi:hypothetical protein